MLERIPKVDTNTRRFDDGPDVQMEEAANDVMIWITTMEAGGGRRTGFLYRGRDSLPDGAYLGRDAGDFANSWICCLWSGIGVYYP